MVLSYEPWVPRRPHPACRSQAKHDPCRRIAMLLRKRLDLQPQASPQELGEIAVQLALHAALELFEISLSFTILVVSHDDDRRVNGMAIWLDQQRSRRIHLGHCLEEAVSRREAERLGIQVGERDVCAKFRDDVADDRGLDTAPRSTPALQHSDVREARIEEASCCGQTGDAGADDQDVGVLMDGGLRHGAWLGFGSGLSRERRC